MADQPTGVLVMAYGTPRDLDDVERYYTHIRGGRRPSDAYLAQLRGRYEAIGGKSPLHEITEAQVKGLGDALARHGHYRLYLGMKHAEPFIEDAVQRMQEDGVTDAAALVLAPHYSKLSVGTYFDRIRQAAPDGRPKFRYIESWHNHPGFVDFAAKRVTKALEQFPAAQREDVRVIFSAHSLPARILREGDPYQEQLHETGDRIAARAGLRHWLYGWQSAGRTDEEWLGPDIRDRIKDLRREGNAHILLCPVGFVSDHLEVLYDVDIEAQALAKDLDVHLVRTESPNADPEFMSALADVVRKHVEADGV